MNGLALQDAAIRTASELPAVTRTYPFGPDHDVFKVAGKMFLMATEAVGHPIITLKCEPPDAEALRQELETITAGYHMNKRHWISIAAGPGITEQLIEELVINAYQLVVDALPKHQRPIRRDGRPRPGGGR